MKAICVTTDLRNQIIWQERVLESEKTDCVHQLRIFPSYRLQRWDGFGGALTDAALHCFDQLPEQRKAALLESLFGKSGLQYNLVRVPMGSCDFSLQDHCCLEADDSDFDVVTELKNVIHVLEQAQQTAGKRLGLCLSPWSPPAFMKSNGQRKYGGCLLPEYWQDWARCMASYAAAYREAGCDVRAVTIQNEPAAVQTWESCIYSGREEGRFAVEALASALEELNCDDITILAWDHNKELLPQRAEETLSIPGAEDVIGGFGIHWYTGDHFDAVRLVHERWPDMAIWHTEGCVEYSRFSQLTAMHKAEVYAHDIIGDINAGVSAYIDWNILLDARGGPNHAGNFCEAPIMLNEDMSDFVFQSEYYYIGHFSRFLHPGATILGSSSWTHDLEAVAFENPDGTQGVTILNRSDQDMPVSISRNAEIGWNLQIAAHAIVSIIW